MFRKLGAFTYRRRWLVVGAWVAIIITGVVSMSTLGNRVTAEFVGSDRLESARVFQRIEELAPTGGDIVVVVDEIAVDDPATVEAVTGGLDQMATVDGIVSVVDPWRTDVEGLVPRDNRAAVARSPSPSLSSP